MIWFATSRFPSRHTNLICERDVMRSTWPRQAKLPRWEIFEFLVRFFWFIDDNFQISFLISWDVFQFFFISSRMFLDFWICYWNVWGIFTKALNRIIKYTLMDCRKHFNILILLRALIFTLRNTFVCHSRYLRESHGLSVRRARRTKSRVSMSRWLYNNYEICQYFAVIKVWNSQGWEATKHIVNFFSDRKGEKREQWYNQQ